MAFLGKMPAARGKIWLLVSIILGVVFVWAITQIYQIETVPTWYNGYTTVAFFMTVLLSGPRICPLIRRKEPHVTGLALGLILVLAGEIIGRGLFYGLHMTVGMAVAG